MPVRVKLSLNGFVQHERQKLKSLVERIRGNIPDYGESVVNCEELPYRLTRWISRQFMG
jgi:hypothetical protein